MFAEGNASYTFHVRSSPLCRDTNVVVESITELMQGFHQEQYCTEPEMKEEYYTKSAPLESFVKSSVNCKELIQCYTHRNGAVNSVHIDSV